MDENVRSFAGIELVDLLRLGDLAADAEVELFERNPAGSGRYAGRLLGRALCQGAALHYVDKHNGVKDFDVWSFYAQHEEWPFPTRWRGTRDFGPSKFGRYPGDPAHYIGRRVDLLGRSLPVPPGADPTDAIRRYLAAAETRSSRELAAKAVVLIYPGDRVGEIVWPLVHSGPGGVYSGAGPMTVVLRMGSEAAAWAGGTVTTDYWSAGT